MRGVVADLLILLPAQRIAVLAAALAAQHVCGPLLCVTAVSASCTLCLPCKTAAALAAFAAEVKEVIVAATAGSSGLSADEIKKQLPAAPAPSSGSAAAPGSIVGAVLPWLQLWSTLASLYYTDKLIKNVFVEFGIKFPSALAGMFGVFALLCVVGDGTASKIMGMYAPALNWIARWLPLFYVPALVTLPMALNGIPGEPCLQETCRRLAGNLQETCRNYARAGSMCMVTDELRVIIRRSRTCCICAVQQCSCTSTRRGRQLALSHLPLQRPSCTAADMSATHASAVCSPLYLPPAPTPSLQAATCCAS